MNSGAMNTDEGTRLSWAAEILAAREERIVAAFEARLREQGSPLLESSRMSAELEAQAGAIIREVAGVLGEDAAASADEDGLSRSIGELRAEAGVHPSDSLRAAAELSEAILLEIAEAAPEFVGRTEIVRVAARIQRSTVERVARGSVSYVEYLMRQVHDSHTDERHRISRELHDRIAGSLAVTRQQLDIYRGLRERDPERAERNLDLAADTIGETLAAARSLSSELRRSVTREGLEVAVSNLLPALVPEETEARLSTSGDESILQAYIKDELFLILREAIHNAARHSGASRVMVHYCVEPAVVRASVADDGCGFDPASVRSGTGRKAMAERAELLRGECQVTSEPGAGTRVEVRVPVR